MLAIDDYSAALTAALDGGAKATAQRNAAAETLCRMLRQLAHYVEANCNDDLTTFLSSGFPHASAARTKALPLSESIRKIAFGPSAGQALVTVVKVPSAVSYELRWAAVGAGGSPGEWTNHPVPSTRPATLSGLTPGTTYAFQAIRLARNPGSGLSGFGESDCNGLLLTRNFLSARLFFGPCDGTWSRSDVLQHLSSGHCRTSESPGPSKSCQCLLCFTFRFGARS